MAELPQIKEQLLEKLMEICNDANKQSSLQALLELLESNSLNEALQQIAEIKRICDGDDNTPPAIDNCKNN